MRFVAERPETRYALTSEGQSIAYQVCGRGDLDLVYVPNWASPIDLMWDHPWSAQFLWRLASFSRLILFDKRGSGSSDHVAPDALATLEDWADDIATVMDAVGSERAALVGSTVGCPIAILFAATHPERTSALVVINGTARMLADRDYAGLQPESVDERVDNFRASWGTAGVLELLAPSLVGDDAFGRWLARFCRVGNPPAMASAVFRAELLTDVRPALGLIQSPTLVLQRADATVVSSQPQGRFLAEHIPGARYIELPGADLLPFVGYAGEVLDPIEKFLTGDLTAPEPNRVLVTVLFTDVVSSTPRVAELGDRRWRNLIATHDTFVRTELDRFRGRAIRFDGDGVLATFDGPGRAIRCACAIRDAVSALDLSVRAGLHTGEIELHGDDIAGIAVHVGKRVQSAARPGEVFVSRTVADLVAGSGIELRDEGEYDLKGVPGTWRLFSVSA